MGKKVTTEEFIERAKEIHGDRYDYSLTEYTGYDKKITIICSVHGEFDTQARCHLKSNCSKCSFKELTTNFESFVEKANKVHNNTYMYDEDSYVNTNKKLNIFCENHGWFKQVGNGHLSGKKCLKCANEAKGSSQRLLQEDFITRAIELHGDKYKYDKSDYKNSHTKVKIWCNECDKYFNQRANLHLKRGCKACADKNNGILKRKSNEDFIEDVKAVHSDFYNYEKTLYNKVTEKIIVTCPLHGDFEIRASDHIVGCGCKVCAKDNVKYNGWSNTDWVKAGSKSKNFIAFQLYLLECTDERNEEIFYKIGKTYINVNYRFSGKIMPYHYNIIKIFEGEGMYISKKERELHKKYTEYRYTPKIIFDGYTECYTMNLPIEEIKALN